MGADKGAALHRGCYLAFKAGVRPIAGSRADEYLFFRPVLVGAGHANDLATFERAFAIHGERLRKTEAKAKAIGRPSYATRQLKIFAAILTRLRAGH